MNPADLPSRGCNAVQLAKSKWWEGPDWMKNPIDEWPTSITSCNEDEVKEEVRSDKLCGPTILF